MTAPGQWFASSGVTSTPSTIVVVFNGSATTQQGLTPLSWIRRSAVTCDV
eukprot:CAMPEP_0171960514 /NCGR_PEP_ID=MMETSP0993-20121228/155864_1 /TAXON_ID=483369 /ORGANISM="non described non described, Strain CCMP2098" /LENGTH=49 /DNA_ID=CAMNT_0012608319 /DNA_START=72 /DNA_END=221 /DNA_ORIENTATION=-